MDLAQIFPKWTNRIPLIIVIIAFFGLTSTVGFIWYYGSPKYTDVGYAPKQPIDYSHKLHAGELGMDCRYCHTTVEHAAVAGIPPTQTCMNCHTLVKAESEKLAVLRDSWAADKSIQWIRIHNLPDYAYFNHSAHLSAGIGCESCHGNIASMEVVQLAEPLSMSWCLDCHREPEQHIRPQEQLTAMNWQAPADQMQFAKTFIEEKKITPPIDCSGCHR